MLYDPKWEVQTKPRVCSLEALVAWLEKMPASRKYNYMDCEGRCLYGQYMASHGIPWKESGASSKEYGTPERDAFCAFVYLHIADCEPWTFGAALTRARALVAEA